MLPRTPLFMLLTASLLAAPSFQPPKPLTVDAASDTLQYDSSIVPRQYSSDDKYTLRGTVINSVTGEAIRGALVQIYFNGQSSMLTGPDGKFQFAGLPPGQSTIMVRKPGFFSEDDFEPNARGQHLATTGPNSSPVVLKLVPEGVIYGRISDEDGEPIEGLPVELLAQHLQNGKKIWDRRPEAITDEDGNFRIAELQPGDYFLSAGPSRNPVALPAQLSQSGAQGIPLVYYPVGSELAAAAPIPITPGKKVEINLTLSAQPFYRVSGSINGYAPNQPVNLQLRNSAGLPLPYNWRFDSANGAFRINGVPAGAYTLHADVSDGRGNSLTASVPLTVNADRSGLHLILLPTVTIPIRMSVIASRTGAERFWEQENYFPAYVQLVARNAGLFELRYGSQQVGERGAASLELQNIAPGTYSVEINPNGPLYVKSAMSGTINLLESDLSLAPGTSPQPIEITLRDDVAFLSGTVSLENRPLNATVLAFSEHTSIPPRIQPTYSGGNFQLSAIPPGTYKILAVDHPDRLEYANPEAVKKYLSKAREVTLSPEQSAKIDLELTKVGE
jgi:Carboxypeptidase regulatory-like domain